MTALTLTPGQVTLADLVRIYREELPVTLDRTAKPGIERAAAAIAAAAAGDAPVYGVNTGFGKLASMRIAPADTATLQRNLILSHCCGVGEAIPRRHARLLMVLKLLSPSVAAHPASAGNSSNCWKPCWPQASRRKSPPKAPSAHPATSPHWPI